VAALAKRLLLMASIAPGVGEMPVPDWHPTFR
jgi:hypothetical protein